MVRGWPDRRAAGGCKREEGQKRRKRRGQLGCNGPKFTAETSKIYCPRLPRKTRPRFNSLAGLAGSPRGLPLNRVKQTISTDKRRGFFDDQWAIAKCGSCSLMADQGEKNGTRLDPFPRSSYALLPRPVAGKVICLPCVKREHPVAPPARSPSSLCSLFTRI